MDSSSQTIALACRLFDAGVWIHLQTRARHKLRWSEFLTLALLDAGHARIVGDITQALGLLSAQTSRLMRSLEDYQYVVCKRDQRDKRKVMVALTPAGTAALIEYRNLHIKNLTNNLHRLSDGAFSVTKSAIEQLQTSLMF